MYSLYTNIYIFIFFISIYMLYLLEFLNNMRIYIIFYISYKFFPFSLIILKELHFKINFAF